MSLDKLSCHDKPKSRKREANETPGEHIRTREIKTVCRVSGTPLQTESSVASEN